MATDITLLPEDGLCFVSFVVKKDSTPTHPIESFSSLPIAVQCIVLTKAWQQAYSQADQQSLCCTCKLARAFADRIIQSAGERFVFDERICIRPSLLLLLLQLRMPLQRL